MAVQTWIYGQPEIRFVGCVLDTYEHNGRDDSDWYAICWDRERQKIVEVHYDTTRCGGGGYAEIDASEQTLREVYRCFFNIGRRDFDSRKNEADAKKFGKGDTVLVVRGSKVKKGTVGKVFWIGTRYNYYSRCNEDRVGIEVDGERLFLPAEYCINNDWENRLLHGVKRKEIIRNFAVNSIPAHYRRYFKRAAAVRS